MKKRLEKKLRMWRFFSAEIIGVRKAMLTIQREMRQLQDNVFELSNPTITDRMSRLKDKLDALTDEAKIIDHAINCRRGMFHELRKKISRS